MSNTVKIKISDLPLGARFSYEPNDTDNVWVILNNYKKRGLIARWKDEGVRVDQLNRQEICCITEENQDISEVEVYWID